MVTFAVATKTTSTIPTRAPAQRRVDHFVAITCSDPSDSCDLYSDDCRSHAQLVSPSRDPIGFKGLQQNLYAYLWSKPVVELDPTGLSPLNLGADKEADLVEQTGCKCCCCVTDVTAVLGNQITDPKEMPVNTDGKGPTSGSDGYNNYFWEIKIAVSIAYQNPPKGATSINCALAFLEFPIDDIYFTLRDNFLVPEKYKGNEWNDAVELHREHFKKWKDFIPKPKPAPPKCSGAHRIELIDKPGATHFKTRQSLEMYQMIEAFSGKDCNCAMASKRIITHFNWNPSLGKPTFNGNATHPPIANPPPIKY